MRSALAPFHDLIPRESRSSWISPANIALVKYWGKRGHQLPANPSLSMTLDKCHTKTTTTFTPADELKVEFRLARELKPAFAHKILNNLEYLAQELPWIKKLHFQIDSENTFPHGAGIASSASGLSAFSLCLTEYLYGEVNAENQDYFYQTASYLSRLASGSACRSVYGGFVSWGDLSDEFASRVHVHPTLEKLNNSVVVVCAEEKQVSSRKGHERMAEHFYAQARFHQARTHFAQTKEALIEGDFKVVGEIMESEALSLHAMMMTSPTPYTLLKPASLTIMEKVKQFRLETQLPIYFTLDAGPNLHLIYPENALIKRFIDLDLTPLAVSIVHDHTGSGPMSC